MIPPALASGARRTSRVVGCPHGNRAAGPARRRPAVRRPQGTVGAAPTALPRTVARGRRASTTAPAIRADGAEREGPRPESTLSGDSWAGPQRPGCSSGNSACTANPPSGRG
ncbi:hypothetical protein HMPREF0682_2835, partial [Propionibacterium acidifaciens F0233]